MKQKNDPSLKDNVREVIMLLMKLDLRGLLLEASRNSLLQFFRYCFVGGLATVVDWAVLYLTEKAGLHYLLAAVAGFFCGLICNYILSKWMVFNGSKAKLDPKKEFIAYAVIGIAGLVITVMLMYVMTEWLQLYFMVSKVIATVLVLFWNFFARKILYGPTV